MFVHAESLSHKMQTTFSFIALLKFSQFFFLISCLKTTEARVEREFLFSETT